MHDREQAVGASECVSPAPLNGRLGGYLPIVDADGRSADSLLAEDEMLSLFVTAEIGLARRWIGQYQRPGAPNRI